MKVLKWLDENFERVICVFLMSVMSSVLFLQVIMRKVFNNSLSWSEEMARYLFIWLIYFGISYGAKAGKHIKVEAFLGIFPKKLRPVIGIIGELFVLGFAVFIIFTSFNLVQKQIKLGQVSPAMHVPMWFMYSAPLVGFIFTGVREVQTIITKTRALLGKEAVHG
jgi:TRAP-type C4-dicarboxylate transport system permease small subunit